MKTGLNHAVRVTVAALSIVLGLNAAEPARAQCPGDLTGNGLVSGGDLGLLLAAWASDGADQPGSDMNADGLVNGADLALLLGAWGPCVGTPSWATLLEAEPNPAVITNPTLRAAIDATGLAWRVRDNASQIEMVLIPPGSFQMGCSSSVQHPCDADEYPVHTVSITQPFYLGRFEVTQAQWQARTGLNPSSFQSPSPEVPLSLVPLRPVDSVSWDAALEFCTQIGARLPTEAEWEFACRGGTTTAFHGFAGFPAGTSQDSLVSQIAWFNLEGGLQTRPVGGKLGNGFGLHDMIGNVWEWTNDRYDAVYYSSAPPSNPPGPSEGSERVIRGADWINRSDNCRTSNRNKIVPHFVSNGLGFRTARTP